MLFSGFDVLGVFVRPPDAALAAEPWWAWFDLEWWHGHFVYPNNVTLIAYAPNQAIGGWLASAVALDALRRGRKAFPLVLPIALCLLWSPLAAIGLALLIAAMVVAGAWRARPRATVRLLRGQASLASMAILGGVVLPIALYLAARASVPRLAADLLPPPEARLVASAAFQRSAMGIGRFTLLWSWFLSVELLPLVAALAAAVLMVNRKRRGTVLFASRLLIASAAVLTLIPYGFYNDWAMRASIPALFALQIALARILARSSVSLRMRQAIATLLIVAGLYPLAQLGQQAAGIWYRRDWLAIVPQEQVLDLFELQRERVPFYGFVEQYVAGVDAPFFRYLAPGLEPRSVPSRHRARRGLLRPDSGSGSWPAVHRS